MEPHQLLLLATVLALRTSLLPPLERTGSVMLRLRAWPMDPGSETLRRISDAGMGIPFCVASTV